MSVCAAKGFRAAGVSAGIKKTGALDLALIVSNTPAAVAATFTTNLGAAAPVQVSRERVEKGTARGVVVNSGCANSFTGKQGYEDALAMADEAAKVLGLPPDDMLVCSTGLIGAYLPMEKVKAGIANAATSLTTDDATASQAIMTTDTRPKLFEVRHSGGWALGGIAKGAAMIAPNMATMLCFITTDARVGAPALKSALAGAVSKSFNRVTIDGDQSTNDTVLCLANGASGISPTPEELQAALDTVCQSLAEQIVRDGEGATKFIRVRVRGAASEEDAVIAARRIAESLLVKTAMFGADANWGRVAAAIGQSRVKADYERLSISIGGFKMLSAGEPATKVLLDEARSALKEDPEPAIECDLSAGDASVEIITTDLSEEYVRLNAAYE